MGNTCCHNNTQHTVKPLNSSVVDVRSITIHTSHSNLTLQPNDKLLHSHSAKSSIVRTKQNIDQYISTHTHTNKLLHSTSNKHTDTNSLVPDDVTAVATHRRRTSASYIENVTPTHKRVPSIKHRSTLQPSDIHSIRGSIRNLPGATHKLTSQQSSNDPLLRSIHTNNYVSSISKFKLNLNSTNSFNDMDTAALSRRKSLRNTRIHFSQHTQDSIDELSPKATVHKRHSSLSLNLPPSRRLTARHSNVPSPQHSSRNDANNTELNLSNLNDEIDVTQSFYNKFSNVQETHSVDIFTNANGAKQINQYIIESELGRGTSAVVKKVLSLIDHKCYAMKVIDQSKLLAQNSGQLHTIQSEIAILKKLNHNNIVKLYEVMHDTTTDQLYCIMEYCELGAVYNEDMFDTVCDPLPLTVALKYFRDTILAINYVHCNKIIHRDIKPSNLLLCSNGTIKVTDFGVSLQFENTDTLHDTKGSAAFMSPETIQRNTTDYSGKASDIWSLGITLYTFIYGKLPFANDNIHELYNIIVSQPLSIPNTPTIPDTLKDLLNRMLDKNPVTRITMSDILQHHWVTENNTWVAAEHDITIMNEEYVAVTDADIANAVITVNKLSMMVKLKQRMKRMANTARNSARNSASAVSSKFFHEVKNALPDSVAESGPDRMDTDSLRDIQSLKSNISVSDQSGGDKTKSSDSYTMNEMSTVG